MWYYKGRPITTLSELPGHEHLIGFVYKITNLRNGKIYIGKKVTHTRRKVRISATEKKKTGTRAIFKQVVKESNWQKYYGSCKELQDDLKKLGADAFRREIIELACTRKYLSYAETAWQIREDVLKQHSYNGNVLGRWYARDMENCTS